MDSFGNTYISKLTIEGLSNSYNVFSLSRKETTTVDEGAERFRKIVEDTDGRLKAIDKYERERALER